MGCQVVMVLDKFRVHNCKSHFVQNLKLQKNLLFEVQVGTFLGS